MLNLASSGSESDQDDEEGDDDLLSDLDMSDQDQDLVSVASLVDDNDMDSLSESMEDNDSEEENENEEKEEEEREEEADENLDVIETAIVSVGDDSDDEPDYEKNPRLVKKEWKPKTEKRLPIKLEDGQIVRFQEDHNDQEASPESAPVVVSKPRLTAHQKRTQRQFLIAVTH